MTWHAQLDLTYRLQQERSVVYPAHSGPLRVLQSLYPEGPAICHNVLVHPPGGLVGGDTLAMHIDVGSGAHALVTTPGATRFYRSTGLSATQTLQAKLAPHARLEWLPLEAIAHDQCQAENRAIFELAPGAELMGWDVTALGLPAAQLPFRHGSFTQHLEIPGVWLEQGRLLAQDTRLMDGPLGLAGHRCLATLFFAAGEPLTRARRELALANMHELLQTCNLRESAGVTSPHEQVLVLRVLAPLVEPAMQLLQAARMVWRETLWGLHSPAPRIWAT